jgi:phage terminase large subunit-like protein
VSDARGVLHSLLDQLTEREALDYRNTLHFDWSRWARPKQLLPAEDWDVLGLVAGRSGGKTRPGSETVIEWAHDNPRIALIGRTIRDARETMVLGESGIIARCPPWFRATYRPTRALVEFQNGAKAFLYSAEEPDQLRGPQFMKLWGDEFAAWKRVSDEKGGDAWSNVQDGLRLGEKPQALLTTTPRPTQLVLDTFLGPKGVDGKRPVSLAEVESGEWKLVTEVKDHLGRPVKHVTICRRWSSEENAANMAPGYVAKRRAKYAGSRLGAQELDAAFLLASDKALWTLEIIDLFREEQPPAARERLVIAVDPTRSKFNPVDECGIVAAMRGTDQHAYVLEDATLRASPYDWASRAVSLASKYQADAIVWETSGTDQSIRDTLRSVPGYDRFRWEGKTASADKKTRAEPVSVLYRAGRVHHVNKAGETFEFLEDEMISWDPVESRTSPNRLDALVWAITDLLLAVGSEAPVVAPGSILGGRA